MSTYYICHCCCTFITIYKNDMRRHCERKNKCKSNNILYTYEESSTLSINKKFICDFDIDEVDKDGILYITTNYTDNVNYIKKDYKIKTNNLNTDLNLTNCLVVTDLNYIYDPILDVYMCNLCKSSFKKKQSIERHILEQKRCIKLQKIEECVKNTQEIVKIIKNKEKEQINNTYIFQDNSVNNTQNNNNNNTNHNTYNLSIRDFVHDSYDISHIKDDFCLQKGFFLYPTFLEAIMENKKNHNVFFLDKEAIIYSDNELNRMSSDKAGYLILDKLNRSFIKLYNRQDEERQKFIEFIKKYYHVISGQYKHDTIYKDYDVDEKKFIYTHHSSMFRSRDKYLNKIISTLSKHKDETRKNMNLHIDQIKDIPLLNPNIEDYASTRVRYRDLKDKD